MAYLSKVLLLNQERVNSMESKTLKTRTKVNTVRGRPAVRELYERSIYERTHDYEWTFSSSRVMQYQISYLLLSYVDFIVYLDVIENPVEYQYEPWNVWGTRAEKWWNSFTSVFFQVYQSLPSCNFTLMWRSENFQKLKNINVSVVQR